MVLFDTIAVEMPMFRAGTLKRESGLCLTAFILFKNGLIKEDEVMNQRNALRSQNAKPQVVPRFGRCLYGYEEAGLL